MIVKFIYESDLCWRTTRDIEVQDNVSEEDIETMFPYVLNVPYNKYDCSYEVVGIGKIVSLAQMLAYTE